MKLSKEKKQNLILTILITVGVIYGVWFWGISKQAKKEKSDTIEKNKIAAEIEKTEKSIKAERNHREQAKSFQVYIADSEAKMPRENVETWFVRELSGIAGKYDLTLLNTSLQPMKELSRFKFSNQPYELVGFSLDLRGEFNQIGSFIRDMENQLPLVEINQLSINSGSAVGAGTPVPHVHTVSITLCLVRKA